jgi:hypothetical protein
MHTALIVSEMTEDPEEAAKGAWQTTFHEAG